MNRLLCTALAAVAITMLAGCAATQTSTEPVLESAGIAGDVPASASANANTSAEVVRNVVLRGLIVCSFPLVAM